MFLLRRSGVPQSIARQHVESNQSGQSLTLDGGAAAAIAGLKIGLDKDLGSTLPVQYSTMILRASSFSLPEGLDVSRGFSSEPYRQEAIVAARVPLVVTLAHRQRAERTPAV